MAVGGLLHQTRPRAVLAADSLTRRDCMAPCPAACALPVSQPAMVWFYGAVVRIATAVGMVPAALLAPQNCLSLVAVSTTLTGAIPYKYVSRPPSLLRRVQVGLAWESIYVRTDLSGQTGCYLLYNLVLPVSPLPCCSSTGLQPRESVTLCLVLGLVASGGLWQRPGG